MDVIESNNRSVFDVDNTLVMWPKSNPNKKRKGHIAFNYGDEIVYLRPNKSHIRFLKHCSLRGDYVEVWSQNNGLWAKHVVETLKLKKYVKLAGPKPNRHIDDKEHISFIVGNRVYLGEE